MTEVAGSNLQGVRVDRSNETDLVIFSSGAGSQGIRHGEWTAEAASLVITESAKKLKIFAAQSARSLRRGNRSLFSSDFPMSVAARFNDEIEVTAHSETATRITLFVGQIPVRIWLDGKELSANAFSFNRTDGTISLAIPRGQHNLKISAR
jgi:hypothetical protein